jgi:hypothetical protein
MKAILKPCASGVIFSLLFLCSCATTHPRLPVDVSMNKDAGCGNGLMVTLRLKSDEELLFAVDTGSPCTFLDKSLEPKLGHRFGTVPAYMMWGSQQTAGVYLAPRLYLGDTPLKMSGNGILTCDLRSVALPGKPPIMGILGMDILENYCIQLDFVARKIRFLNSDHLNVADLGKALPISFYSEARENEFELVHPFIQQPSLLGGAVTNVFIDTGLRVEGSVDPELFQREMRQGWQEGTAIHGIGRVWFAKCVWGGDTYTNLLIGPGGGAFENGQNPNFIGLGFLARHLVTFDFPHRMMYLKQTRAGPLVDEDIEAAEALLNVLKAKGELPGWPANDIGTIYFDMRGFHIQFDGRKNGDPSDYHYQFGRLSQDSPWKLQKAWRTDQDGKTIEEFPVP